MCRKLIQVYACGHTKTICTTACPHAIETGRQVPQIDNNTGLARSLSTVSTLIASTPYRGHTPAHSSSPSSPAPRPSIDPQRVPQSLFPSQPKTSLERLGHSPTSPTPSYTKSTSPAPTLTTSPSFALLLPGQSPPTADEIEIEPNFCPYYFPHNLPQSNHPCIECFVKPEWEHRAARWMKEYKTEHLLTKAEDVERLSGVEYLKEKQRYMEMREREREGKLNVFLDGDKNAGRVL